MSATTVRTVSLEVERKFARLLVHPLRIDGGRPAFRELVYLGPSTFHDHYFDDRNLLSRSGTWLRQRDGRWESKIRQAGNYNHSQFEEVQDIGVIGQHIHRLTKTSRPPSEAFGLSQTADIITYRESWKADGLFKIVLDRTDFGHVVGEVELEDVVDVASDLDTRKHCDLMDAKIVSFMKRYAWAFDDSPAVGKLSAYFHRRKP